MKGKALALLPLVLLAVLTGCGESREEADALPPVEDRCPGGKTEPLDVQTVVEVARRHGITLYNDPQCQPDPTIVSTASNQLLWGPNTNVGEHREIDEREGFVSCMLGRGAELTPRVKRAPPEVRRIRYEGDEETHFRAFNVDCVIYPDSEHAEAQLTRLEQTMNELRDRAAR